MADCGNLYFTFYYISLLIRSFIVNYSAPVGEQSIAISSSVCLCMCVCLSTSICLEPLDRSSLIFADRMWLWLGVPVAALRYVLHFQFYG